MKGSSYLNIEYLILDKNGMDIYIINKILLLFRAKKMRTRVLFYKAASLEGRHAIGSPFI